MSWNTEKLVAFNVGRNPISKETVTHSCDSLWNIGLFGDEPEEQNTFCGRSRG